MLCEVILLRSLNLSFSHDETKQQITFSDKFRSSGNFILEHGESRLSFVIQTFSKSDIRCIRSYVSSVLHIHNHDLLDKTLAA